MAPKYTGFLPTVSDNGPVNGAPVPMPKRYIAVSKFWAVRLTWNFELATELAIDSEAPAQPWTKMRIDKTAIFLHREINGQFCGLRGSPGSLLTNMCCCSLAELLCCSSSELGTPLGQSFPLGFTDGCRALSRSLGSVADGLSVDFGVCASSRFT